MSQANMNFMEEMVALGKDLGLDYIHFRTSIHGSECLLPEQVTRVERLIQELRISHQPFGVYGRLDDHQVNTGCWFPASALMVDACGEVHACPHSAESANVAPFGNLLKENATALWFGLPHKRAVRSLQANACRIHDCCWRFKPDFPEFHW